MDYDLSGHEKLTSQKIYLETHMHYKTLSEIEPPTGIPELSNVYSIDEFKLIINNQIALYQITGQLFALIAFKLDPEAERSHLLTINQLRNAIRLSTDKKDKICTIGDKVIVLITRGTKDAATKLIAKIKINLPDDKEGYLQLVSKLISIYAINVDKETENAESMLSLLTKNRPVGKK